MEIHHTNDNVNNAVEYIKFTGIIIGILIIAWFVSGSIGVFSVQYMMTAMGIFLIVFALFQLIGYKSFVSMFPSYDPIARIINIYAYAYPFIGLILGVCYLLDIGGVWRDGFTAFIFLIGALGVYVNIQKDGSRPHCACLGNIIKLPLSWVTFFEDSLMGIMALIMLFLS